MADELPTLNQYGLLDPGVHCFSLEIIERTFAPLGSPRRRKLFANLKKYLRELWAFEPMAEVILDGSFVMPRVDGDLGPSDIDLIVVLPTGWWDEAPPTAAEYNCLSHAKAREQYYFDVLVVEAGSIEEKLWIDFFARIRDKWYEAFDLPNGCEKGIVRVLQ